jgi:hypothetical protein
MDDPRKTDERLILFTLVDLLIQVIFFGFFLFAANQATQGGVQRQVAVLARVFGIVSVTKYLDAPSRLISISDLGKLEVAALSDKPRKTFEDIISLLDRLNTDDLHKLVAMDARQRSEFVDLYNQLSPVERSQFRDFLKRYGTKMIGQLLATRLKKSELESILATLSKLPGGDQGAFIAFGSTCARVDLNLCREIIAKGLKGLISLPTCFDERQALSVREVPSAYRVRPLIPEVESETRLFSGSALRAGDDYELSEVQFSAFAARMSAAHPKCTIRVLQSTAAYVTKSDVHERQLKLIQRWFRTW